MAGNRNKASTSHGRLPVNNTEIRRQRRRPLRSMILVFEMVWTGSAHATTNSAMIQTVARGFVEQPLRVFAEHSHLQELQSDPNLHPLQNISYHAVPISAHFQYRPQIVSFRRGLREFWTLLRALRYVPPREPCLIVLLSATPTAIFAAALLSRLTRRIVRTHVVLHGNLNDAFGWRSRNPLARAIDLQAALTHRHGGRVRLLVLEDAIRRALSREAPITADTTDVLRHPVDPLESANTQPATLARPLRLGLVGQANEAKGITPFLTLAAGFRVTHPATVHFYVVGNPRNGSDMTRYAALQEPPQMERFTRVDFVEKLQHLHYVCMPMQPGYYALSASGALLDAINWLKPVITTRVPIVADLFERFGDIGELCDDLDSMRAAIEKLALNPDPDRYARQVATLRRIRASRVPAALGATYRETVARVFPDLLPLPRNPDASHG